MRRREDGSSSGIPLLLAKDGRFDHIVDPWLRRNARPYGLLQALPIWLEHAEWHVNIDSDTGYDAVATIVDPPTKRVCWIPVGEAELTAEKFAMTSIANYVRSRSLPTSIVSDRDIRFTSDFWQALCSQLGIKLRISTAYHPQSDWESREG